MATKLFVGSLPYALTDEELSEIFGAAGTVVSAKVIMDRDSGRSKGFGFVEMSTEDEAKAAISQLNGKDVNGRAIVVNEARPQENRERRSFGGGDYNNHRDNGGGGYNRQY
jgi:cold-inducible RNA-binding protein